MAGKPRGYQAALERKLPTSNATIPNVLVGKRGIGIDLAHKLAKHWGMTYAELEQIACGDAPSLAPPASLDELRALLEAELPAAVRKAIRGISGEHDLGLSTAKKKSTPSGEK